MGCAEIAGGKRAGEREGRNYVPHGCPFGRLLRPNCGAVVLASVRRSRYLDSCTLALFGGIPRSLKQSSDTSLLDRAPEAASDATY